MALCWIHAIQTWLVLDKRIQPRGKPEQSMNLDLMLWTKCYQNIFWHIWKNMCVGIIFNIINSYDMIFRLSSKDIKGYAKYRQRGWETETEEGYHYHYIITDITPICYVSHSYCEMTLYSGHTHTHIGAYNSIFPKHIPRMTSYKTNILSYF